MDFWTKASAWFGGPRVLEDLPKPQPTWVIGPQLTVESVIKKRNYSITTSDTPMLKIEDVVDDGRIANTQMMNLAAVDEFIRELIKQRDILASLQKKGE